MGRGLTGATTALALLGAAEAATLPAPTLTTSGALIGYGLTPEIPERGLSDRDLRSNHGAARFSVGALFHCRAIADFACGDSLAMGVGPEDLSLRFDTANPDMGVIGGRWSFAPAEQGGFVPEILVIQAGARYAVYDIAGLSSGAFSSRPDSEDAAILQISFFGGPLPTLAPSLAEVPLPAPALLLLSGLTALAFAGRSAKGRRVRRSRSPGCRTADS